MLQNVSRDSSVVCTSSYSIFHFSSSILPACTLRTMLPRKNLFSLSHCRGLAPPFSWATGRCANKTGFRSGRRRRSGCLLSTYLCGEPSSNVRDLLMNVDGRSPSLPLKESDLSRKVKTAEPKDCIWPYTCCTPAVHLLFALLILKAFRKFSAEAVPSTNDQWTFDPH